MVTGVLHTATVRPVSGLLASTCSPSEFHGRKINARKATSKTWLPQQKHSSVVSCSHSQPVKIVTGIYKEGDITACFEVPYGLTVSSHLGFICEAFKSATGLAENIDIEIEAVLNHLDSTAVIFKPLEGQQPLLENMRRLQQRVMVLEEKALQLETRTVQLEQLEKSSLVILQRTLLEEAWASAYYATQPAWISAPGHAGTFLGYCQGMVDGAIIPDLDGILRFYPQHILLYLAQEFSACRGRLPDMHSHKANILQLALSVQQCEDPELSAILREVFIARFSDSPEDVIKWALKGGVNSPEMGKMYGDVESREKNDRRWLFGQHWLPAIQGTVTPPPALIQAALQAEEQRATHALLAVTMNPVERELVLPGMAVFGIDRHFGKRGMIKSLLDGNRYSVRFSDGTYGVVDDTQFVPVQPEVGSDVVVLGGLAKGEEALLVAVDIKTQRGLVKRKTAGPLECNMLPMSLLAKIF